VDLKSSIVPPYFFRDLAEGIQQQMFFWGQDVVHLEGNFLLDQGFARSSSKGLKGTSCYRREWQGGNVELYGACAGWYGRDHGFAFIRPQHRCVTWLSGEMTPVPGAWQVELIDKSVTRAELYQASLPFLDWLIFYENAVLTRLGSTYRAENYKQYKKVPKAKSWLSPSDALRWFKCFRETPELLVRPKNLSRLHYA
jgi:hypothetical protein